MGCVRPFGWVVVCVAIGCTEAHGPPAPGPDDSFLMCDHMAAATLVLDADATGCVEAVIGPGPTAECPEPPPCEEDICIDTGPWEPIAGVPVLLYVFQEDASLTVTDGDGAFEMGTAYPSSQVCGSCLARLLTSSSGGGATGTGASAGLSRLYIVDPEPGTSIWLCPEGVDAPWL